MSQEPAEARWEQWVFNLEGRGGEAWDGVTLDALIRKMMGTRELFLSSCPSRLVVGILSGKYFGMQAGQERHIAG